MARVVAFVPDLLFGSNVLGMLQAAGHEVALVNSVGGVNPDATDLLVVDLTADAERRIAALSGLGGVRKLAFYAHVEPDVRAAALEAGIDQVVPRSRFAREGAALVEGLLSEPRAGTSPPHPDAG